MYYKTKKVSSILLILGFNCIISSQTNVRGTIKSQNSNEVLPYVNIGIIDKGIGTVTDDKGQFELNIFKYHHLDSLRVSIIGYTSQIFLVEDFIAKIRNSNIIYLEEKTEQLDEVVLTNKKMRTKILGNRTKSKIISDGFDSDKLGSEAGIVIKVKKRPTRIKKFSASIAKNEHKELKFRLNFYNLKNGMPNETILNENIIITSTIKKGLLEVNLEEYDIVVEDDFFVSLEWIKDFGIGELKFSIALLGSPVIYRDTSQGHWFKESLIGPGFNVTVEQ